jgi:hypothetical protein
MYISTHSEIHDPLKNLAIPFEILLEWASISNDPLHQVFLAREIEQKILTFYEEEMAKIIPYEQRFPTGTPKKVRSRTP